MASLRGSLAKKRTQIELKWFDIVLKLFLMRRKLTKKNAKISGFQYISSIYFQTDDGKLLNRPIP